MTRVYDRLLVGTTVPYALRVREVAHDTSLPFRIYLGSTSATFRLGGYREEDDLREDFVALADEWHAETGHLSSPVQIATHPAYQRIIGLGERVIPLILQDLRTRGGQWYWALRALTGASPVPVSAAGNIRVATQAWLDWGRQQGYIA